MEQTSQREIRAMDPTWSLAELLARLPKALANDGSAIALIVKTSGSMGVAKEVGISANALIASAQSSHEFLGAKPGHIWSLLLPLTHIAGINVLVRSLELGTTPIDAREIQGKYPYADFTAIVPTQLYRALSGDHDLLEHLLSAQAVLVGGGAIMPTLREQARIAGINVIETYGMTETCGGCVYNGKPLPGTVVKINEQGIIRVSGKTLATTYLNDPELWKEKISDGFFNTSDLGKFVDGKLIVTGRADYVIISGGENISLLNVQALIDQTFTGINCAVFAVKDSEWGDLLCLAIAGEVKPEQSVINECLSSQISNAAKIKKIIYLQELPRTSLGKIDRDKLVEISNDGAHD